MQGERHEKIRKKEEREGRKKANRKERRIRERVK